MTQGSAEIDEQGYEMVPETAVEYSEGDQVGLVEVAVEVGDDIADVHVENAEVGVDLRLSADELRDLIAALTTALDTVEANS